MPRIATRKRETKETSVLVDLCVDGTGIRKVQAGLTTTEEVVRATVGDVE